MDAADSQASDLRRALDVIGDKWSALILYYLHSDGPSRFLQCQAAGHMSSRTLSQRLVSLERAGLITKKEFNEYPPRTEYALTTKGMALMPSLQALAGWAGSNLTK